MDLMDILRLFLGPSDVDVFRGLYGLAGTWILFDRSLGGLTRWTDTRMGRPPKPYKPGPIRLAVGLLAIGGATWFWTGLILSYWRNWDRLREIAGPTLSQADTILIFLTALMLGLVTVVGSALTLGDFRRRVQQP